VYTINNIHAFKLWWIPCWYTHHVCIEYFHLRSEYLLLQLQVPFLLSYWKASVWEVAQSIHKQCPISDLVSSDADNTDLPVMYVKQHNYPFSHTHIMCWCIFFHNFNFFFEKSINNIVCNECYMSKGIKDLCTTFFRGGNVCHA